MLSALTVHVNRIAAHYAGIVPASSSMAAPSPAFITVWRQSVQHRIICASWRAASIHTAALTQHFDFRPSIDDVIRFACRRNQVKRRRAIQHDRVNVRPHSSSQHASRVHGAASHTRRSACVNEAHHHDSGPGPYRFRKLQSANEKPAPDTGEARLRYDISGDQRT